MRKFLLCIVCSIFVLSFSHAQQFKLGIGSIIHFSDDAFIALQGRATYDFNEKYAISGNANIHISDVNDWSQDIDFLYRLFTVSDVLTFSPFGGININNGIALNLGSDLSFVINEKIFYAAPKFVVDQKSYFAVSFGVLFPIGD